MKLKILFFLLLLFHQNSIGQNFYLEITTSQKEKQIIDSLNYSKKHLTIESLENEIKSLGEKIHKKGYFNFKTEVLKKKNDSIYTLPIVLNNEKKYTFIYIPEKIKKLYPLFFNKTTDTLKIKTEKIDTEINQILEKFEKNGQPFTKIKLIDHSIKNENLYCTLQITSETKRHIDQIVINDYPKFPKNIHHQLEKQFRKKEFSAKNIEKLNTEINNLRFLSQSKYPETLFTNDSTKVFIYPTKNKANQFEGFIGFTNNEKKKLIFNGFLDIQLHNTIRKGEKFSLYWKSDGKKQKTFNASLEIPYIFKLPLGIKGELNIFKQDTTFQNTKTNISLAYFLNFNSKIYLGYEQTESSDIQNINSNLISDFKTNFYNLKYEFTRFKNINNFSQEKNYIFLYSGFGKRNATKKTSSQSNFHLIASHLFEINQKNYVHIKTENYILESKDYLTNELKRFGGINSIRGFNENSLQASNFNSLLTEYRYFPNSSLYLNTITDFAYIKDKSTQKKNNLLSLGIGTGIYTKNGLIKIIYANGRQKNQPFKLSNSILQINFNTYF